MKEVQEFTANHSAGQYPFNLHVLGFNYSSTEAQFTTRRSSDLEGRRMSRYVPPAIDPDVTVLLMLVTSNA